MRVVGYSGQGGEFRIYSLHLKASTGFESQRLAEATGLRDSLNALPPGVPALVCGDYNFYTGLEPAMQKLIESQTNNTGRLYDPLGLQNIAWQDNTGHAVGVDAVAVQDG
jgi:endonuclease/exonuclease/phosphatase family metal-dependent hydrolase